MRVAFIFRDTHGSEELRYALRALETNAKNVTEVVVIGDVPNWLTGCKTIPHKGIEGEHHKDQARKIKLAAELGKGFILMHDDIFVMEPTDFKKIPMYGLAPWSDVLGMNAGNKKRLMTTFEQLRLKKDNVCVEGTHSPFLVSNAKKMIEACDLVLSLSESVQIKSAYQKLRQAPIKLIENGKVLTPRKIKYLSTSPQSWDGEVGKYIRNTFKEKSKYETTN